MGEQQDTFALMLQGSCSYTPLAERESIKLSKQIILKYLSHPTRSGARPGDEEVMKFMMLCRSRALNPFEGDAYLLGYDGKNGPEFSIVTAIQALYKRAESNPDYDGIESGVIVKSKEGEVVERPGDFIYAGDALLGGWARVWRKSQSHPTVERLNLENRDKGRSQWVNDKAGMIVKCAEAGALRRAFPNQMSALYIAGEVIPDGRNGVDADVVDATPAKLTPGRQSTKPQATVTQAPKPPAPGPAAGLTTNTPASESAGGSAQSAPADAKPTETPAETAEEQPPDRTDGTDETDTTTDAEAQPEAAEPQAAPLDRKAALEEIRKLLDGWEKDPDGAALLNKWSAMVIKAGRTVLNYMRADDETLAAILSETRAIDKGI